MATTKPRITVTLTERQYELVKSISDNSGQTMSSFISELLENSLPVMERMAETFRKIKELQDAKKKMIAHELEKVESEIEPAIAGLIDQYDLFASAMEFIAGVSDESVKTEETATGGKKSTAIGGKKSTATGGKKSTATGGKK